MTPKWFRTDPPHSVTLQAYVDRITADLRSHHDTTSRMLQEEIDRRIGELTRERDARFTEIAKRVETANEALNIRLEAMNEFRASMREQAATFVRQDTITALDAAIADRLDKVEAALDRARGRMSVYAGLLAAIVAVITIVTLVINHIKL